MKFCIQILCEYSSICLNPSVITSYMLQIIGNKGVATIMS